MKIHIAAALALMLAATASGQKAERPKVGLVLSGGGAKGVAHAGVIKALEENDIPIDCVAGTSMGAIIGSLYSCGWSPERMIDFITAPDFRYWSTGTIDKNQVYYISSPEASPEWVSVNFALDGNKKGVGGFIPTSLINPIPMNIEFLELYAPYSEQCEENFNNLFVPFRCVTSDVYHKHKIVLGNGSLGDAVRASMSFPLVYRPIKMNGVLVYDGGIYDNFPVDVMREDFDPDFIIGVSVSSADSKPKEGNIYSQLEDMIIQNNDYSVPADEGVKIQVPVLDFGVLDFDKAATIYDIGYKTGLSMVDSIKKRVSARVPLEEVTARREAFAKATPHVEFDSVKVTGADPDQARYLEYLFEGPGRKKIDLEQVRNSYYRAVTDGTLSNLLPQAEFGADGRNTLLLEATPRKPFSVGVGGWVTSSVNSMLYLDLGWHTLSFNSLDIGLSCWIGQSYYAGMLSARFTIRSAIPSYLQLQGVLSKQKYYDDELLFYETDTPTFITEVDNFLRVKYVWAMGRRAAGYAGLTWGYLSDSYYPTNTGDFARASKDRTKYRIGALRVGFDGSTLNDPMYPDAGYSWKTEVQGSYERSRFIPGGDTGLETPYDGHFRISVEADWKKYFRLSGKMRLGLAANALATLQPLSQNYTATLIHAAAFAPTPSTRNYFNEAFRSDNYVAAGVMPVYTPFGKFQLRGDFYVYAPIRNISRVDGNRAMYDGWFRRTEFIGEIAAVYNFPFASLSVYGNYLSYPARNWNFGINLGLLIQAPRLLR